MYTLTNDALKTVISELLIKKIGEKWKIGSLIKFKRTKNTPRCYFFGINKETNNFHWIFINTSFKITDFNNLQAKVKKTIESVTEKSENTEVKEEEAIRILRRSKRDIYFLEPLLAMESPIEPKNGKGLTMLAFEKGEVYYSPFSILDPKSSKPDFWDKILGIEETIYLPIKKIQINDNVDDIGVLCISWDTPGLVDKRNIDSNFLYEKVNDLLEKNDNLVKKILKENDFDSIKKFINNDNDSDNPLKITELFSNNIRRIINDEWNILLKDPSIKEGLKLLDLLSQNTIKIYKQNLYYFDDMIIDMTISSDIEQSDNELFKLVNSIHSFNCDPIDKIKEYIHNNREDIATVKYYEKLQSVEPLLQNIGTKDHYIHMFNVFLLGNILYKNLFNDDNNYKREIWREIALSHDLAYPIETIEEQLKSFFEVYFNRGKTPDLYISKSLYFCYSGFSKDLNNLIKNASKLISMVNEKDKKYNTYSILEDLVMYSLHERSDHAVLSALFTMHANKLKHNKYMKAIPILLHNLYQWKYYTLEEFQKIRISKNKNKENAKRENLIIDIEFNDSDNDDIIMEIAENHKFTNFVYEKRFEKEITILYKNLRKAKKTEVEIKPNIEEKLRNLIEEYEDSLRNLQIKITPEEENPIKKYTFLLSLSDFIQEWGRFIGYKKGLISLGLRISKIEENVISLSCPYIRKKKRIFNPDKGSTKMLWKCLYLDENDDPKIDKDFLNLFEKTHLYKCDNIYKKIWKEIDQEIEDHIKQYRSWEKKEKFDKSMNYATLALTELLIKKYLEFQYKFLFNKIGGKNVGLFDFTKDFLQIEFEGLRYNEETRDWIKIPK